MSDQPLSKLHKVVAIVGPTATGKTALALTLAEQAVKQGVYAGAVLISVDSRQVYRGLEVCTGADVPSDWTASSFAYQHPQLPIFLCGTSLISPVEEWSVSHFRHYASPIIHSAFAKQMMVILVGGTGLYHEHLFSSDELLTIPPDEELRSQAALLSLVQLQEKVQTVAPDYWERMNSSDRANPRRLIRAIEKQTQQQLQSSQKLNSDALFDLSKISYATVGITDNVDTLEQKIQQRVDERLRIGALAEVEALIAKYSDQEWKLPAFTSTGCKEVRAYLESIIDLEQLKILWTRRELQYAKRQLTWWKKHRSATSLAFAQKFEHWYDLSQEEIQDWQTAVLESCILNK